MTTSQIEKAKATAVKKASTKFDVAAQLRSVLDAARAQYGASDWDDEDLEADILEILSE